MGSAITVTGPGGTVIPVTVLSSNETKRGFTVPLTPGSKCFLRLRVTQQGAVPATPGQDLRHPPNAAV